MLLKKLLPRELAPGSESSECASLMTSLIMGVHLERSTARAIGWRGVRGSASDHPAWTIRLANSENIFGLRFAGENLSQDGKVINGYFELFVFPQAQSPLLELYPLQALAFALSETYADSLRNFQGNEREFAPFRLGWLRLDAHRDGLALGFVLEAPARHRIVALQGIRANHCQNGTEADDLWLVPPGMPVCNLPSFRLLLPLFSALVASAEQILDLSATLELWHERIPGRGFDASGQEFELSEPGQCLSIIRLAASFDENEPPRELTQKNSRTLMKLPARYKPSTPHHATKPTLHLLCGFLGAGKTTFLRRWLDFLHGRERYTGVIQNEFGSVDLDSSLLQDDTLVEALDDGCVCCSLADSLRPGLRRILSELPAQQFILECSGLANPANVLEAVGQLEDLVQPGLLICMADALNLSQDSDWQNEDKGGIRFAQIANADVIILNKCDLVSETQKLALTEHLHTLNPNALLLFAIHGSIPFAELDAWLDSLDRTQKILPPNHHGLNRRTHSGEGYASASAIPKTAIPRANLEKLLLEAGPALIRAKGILDLCGEGAMVIQYAQGKLEISPARAKPSGIALIGRGLNLEALAASIEACLQRPNQSDCPSHGEQIR